MSQINPKTFVLFFVVGGSATLLHYAIMWGLMTYAAVSATNASAYGFVVGGIANYLANAYFTFGGGHRHQKALPKFIATSTMGLAMNQLVLALGISVGLPVLVAQILATGVVFLWNYVINAIWTFKK